MVKKLVLLAMKVPADVPDSAQLRPQNDKDPAASRRLAINKALQPNPSLSSPTDHSGNKKASPSKGTWADAAAQRPNSPISALTLRKTGEKICLAPPSAPPIDYRLAPRLSSHVFPLPRRLIPGQFLRPQQPPPRPRRIIPGTSLERSPGGRDTPHATYNHPNS